MANGSLAVDLPLNTNLLLPASNQGPVACRVEPNAALVFSVFGRFGNVVAQTGDYRASQITFGASSANVGGALADNVQAFGVLPTNTGAQNDAALAVALANSSFLYWPTGAYPSAASIPNLHSVRHSGPGRITRGADTFWLEPRYNQTNTLYVSAAGSAANDGLTASQPMNAAATLFAALANYGPELNGFWRGSFAAGTYPTVNASFAVPSKNLVTFFGPDPGSNTGLPTVLIDGTGGGSSDFGMRSTGPGVQVLWQDLKFQNYSGPNTIALLADYGSDLWTHNVHVATSTGQGVYGEGCQIVRMTGGIIDGCRQGILLNACQFVTLGYQHTTAADGIVRNCTQANIEWSRGTQGHCDYMTISGSVGANSVGIDVFHDSRTHLMGNAFTSNVTAIRARSGGFFLLDTSIPNVFTTNTLNTQSNAYSGETDANLWVSISEVRRAYSTNSVTHTGTTAKTTLLLPWVIPQGFFCTPSANASTKKIRVVVHGQFTTAGAASLIGVDFDAVQIDQLAAVAPAANSKFRYEVEIWADGNSAQYKSAVLVQNGGPSITNQGSSAQNMANAARNLNITGQLVTAGDSMRIDRTEVWVSGL